MNFALACILCFVLPVLATTLGSSLVFFMKNTSKSLLTITLGFAAGVMTSASMWSLLLPAIEEATISWKNLFIVPIVLGFAFGTLFMLILEALSSKFFEKDAEKGKIFRFFTAITIHNIPEGLSIGFALGSAFSLNSSPLSAFLFALGIALQNLPEGLATALPIYSSLKNHKKSFILGALSGIVEPIFTLVGFYLASTLASLTPWLLAFSAGTVIFITIQELTPEIHQENHSYGTLSFAFGFLFMMILDLVF